MISFRQEISLVWLTDEKLRSDKGLKRPEQIKKNARDRLTRTLKSIYYESPKAAEKPIKNLLPFSDARLKKVRRVYEQFFTNRGLKKSAWDAFQAIVGDDLHGKNPEEFDDELKAMIACCQQKPVPKLVRQLMEGSDNSTNPDGGQYQFIKHVEENQMQNGWRLIIEPQAALNRARFCSINQ